MAAYIEAMQSGFEKPSVKQHLAAIRMLFDWLVIGQVVPPIRPTPSADRSMWLRTAKPRCSMPTRPARCWIASICRP